MEDSEQTISALVLNRLRQEKGRWVPLPELCRASRTLSGMSNAIRTLRTMGHVIVNRLRRVDDRQHSWYMLAVDAEERKAEQNERGRE